MIISLHLITMNAVQLLKLVRGARGSQKIKDPWEVWLAEVRTKSNPQLS